MADFAYTLEAAPILGGTDLGIGQNRIVERYALTLISVAIPQNGEAGIAEALQKGWNLSLPEPTRSSHQGEVRAIRTAPDQMLLLLPQSTPDVAEAAHQTLANAGYTTDQTGAWVVLEISGPDTLRAMERLCPLDFAQFPQDGSARTAMEHIGALVIRLDANRALLLSASSSARCFLHAVELSYRYVQDA